MGMVVVVVLDVVVVVVLVVVDVVVLVVVVDVVLVVVDVVVLVVVVDVVLVVVDVVVLVVVVSTSWWSTSSWSSDSHSVSITFPWLSVYANPAALLAESVLDAVVDDVVVRVVPVRAVGDDARLASAHRLARSAPCT